jgi:tripartite-type tricarboxylate transporter receptor subunit TctC
MKKLLCAFLLAAVPVPALAQERFPSRPVRFVVPWPPGGTVDVVMRLMAPKLSELLGQSVVVENRAGASGMIGTDLVAKSPNDGHTIAVASATHVVTPLLPGAAVPFDPFKDFDSVILIGKSANVLSVPAAFPVSSVRELIAYAKERPGKLSLGHAGNGTANHLTAEMFLRRAGIDVTLIPYKGGGPVMTDLMGGQIQLGFNQISTVLPHIRSGKVKPIGIAAGKRSAVLPNVQTIEEAGFPDFTAHDWYAFVVPAGTPREAIARLAADTDRTLSDSTVRARLDDLGAEIEGGGPPRLDEFLRGESAKWGAVIKATGATGR